MNINISSQAASKNISANKSVYEIRGSSFYLDGKKALSVKEVKFLSDIKGIYNNRDELIYKISACSDIDAGSILQNKYSVYDSSEKIADASFTKSSELLVKLKSAQIKAGFNKSGFIHIIKDGKNIAEFSPRTILKHKSLTVNKGEDIYLIASLYHIILCKIREQLLIPV